MDRPEGRLMTGMDTFFVVIAAIDLIAVGVMAAYAVRMLQTAREAQRRAEPAIRGARAVADIGQSLATRVSTDGRHVAERVTGVAERVKRRVQTTRRIAAELKPGGSEAADAVRQASTDIAGRARSMTEMAQRLQRLKTATQAAARAARNGDGTSGIS
jgi:hypothetical protein